MREAGFKQTKKKKWKLQVVHQHTHVRKHTKHIPTRETHAKDLCVTTNCLSLLLNLCFSNAANRSRDDVIRRPCPPPIAERRCCGVEPPTPAHGVRQNTGQGKEARKEEQEIQKLFTLSATRTDFMTRVVWWCLDTADAMWNGAYVCVGVFRHVREKKKITRSWRLKWRKANGRLSLYWRERILRGLDGLWGGLLLREKNKKKVVGKEQPRQEEAKVKKTQ